jgi:hypothetical protein
MTSYTAEEASRINRRNKRLKLWKRVAFCAALILIPLAVILHFYLGVYHSMSPMKLSTPTARAFCGEMESRHGELESIKVSFRAFGHVTVECSADEWTADRAREVAEEILTLLSDPEFQKEYSEKHARRYEGLDPEPQFAVIRFVGTRDGLPVYTWTSSRPFDAVESAPNYKFN